MTAARIELHYAAQILAACVDAWLPHRADDGHTAMTWRSPALVGELPLELHCTELVLRAGPRAFDLRGATLADGLAWADAALGPPRGAHLRDYDLPESDLRGGGRFAGDPAGLAAVAGAYDAGFAALRRAAAGEALASPLRVWPHHFDLGAILAGGLGIGLSPGDRFYAAPYYYVLPARPVASAPRIGGGGFWRTDDWQGAVLLVASGGDPDEFLRSAKTALR